MRDPAVTGSPRPCRAVASTVVGGVATFTVGPRGCEGQTPPLSFSTSTLKDGMVHPFTSQVAFAHSADNGASYGPGSYTLVAPLPECNWQADLYIGASQPSAPHVHPISGMNVGWDYREGNVCASAPNPSPTPTTTPCPTRSATPTPSPTPSSTPTYVSEVLSAPVPTAIPSPSTTYVSEVLDAQPNLAATGSSVGPVLGGALVLLVAGGALVTLRRRSGQRS